MLNLIPLQEAAQGSGVMSILMIVLLFVVFYFFMIRPQQKRQKEIRKFREGLSKGSRIVTAGGIKGTITSVNNDDFEVEISKGVRINVDKGSVYPSAADANTAAQQNPNSGPAQS